MTPKQIPQYLSRSYGVATQPLQINGVWTAQYRSLKELGRSVKEVAKLTTRSTVLIQDDEELGEWQRNYTGGWYEE